MGEQVRMFDPEARLFPEGAVCWLKLRVGQVQGPGGRREGEKKENGIHLINTHSAPIDQGAQAIQLLFYGAKDGSLGGLCLALS